MAFNNYLEDENDKPYFTTNSLGYYYDKMEGFAEKVEQAAKVLNVTKEEVEKNITAYIEQNKIELDQRLAQWDEKLETFDSSVETLLTEWVDDGTLTSLIDITLIEQKIAPVALQSAETAIEVNKRFLTPQFIEYFGSFNRFGLGTPSGVANYTGGNYVLTVSGNSGEPFVTVQSGNIADAGTTTRWACVIENNDGLFDVNQVTGTDGISRVNLLEPLKKSIVSKRLGSLHDAVQGQHYTELGYFAYTQHFYKMNPRHVERESYISRFKPDDTSGKWASNAWNGYGQAHNMVSNNYFKKIGLNGLFVNAVDNSHYVEWEQTLGGEKGYLESYLGVSEGALNIEFYKDGVLAEVKNLTTTGNRIIFDYENVNVAKIKIKATGTQGIYVGLTTWWKNEKFQNEKIINPNDKVVYIGDSWGEFHNKATTRELKRLMIQDGGNPVVLDYSKGGHTSDYALAWFEEYVLKNKPNKVIIEYFTNDFNSMGGGVNVGSFVAPDGTSKDMNIANLNEYVNNIKSMIARAIENGIQPIIIMPASTNSESQLSRFINNAVNLWLGKSLSVENPTFKNVTTEKAVTNLVESGTSSKVGEGSLKLLSKEINSSLRKGVISDSSVNLTASDIHGFYNNGVRKAGVSHDGTVDMTALKLVPRAFDVTASAANNGIAYLYNGDGSAGTDEFRIIMKNSDGTFAVKKLTVT